MDDETRAKDPGPGQHGSPTSADACMIVPAPEPDPVAVMLRRRREASLRLPPLADGRRDPLDRLRGAR